MARGRKGDRRLILALEAVLAIIENDDRLLEMIGQRLAAVADGGPALTREDAARLALQVLQARAKLPAQLEAIAALAERQGPARRVM
jgi:hypothetical protein